MQPRGQGAMEYLMGPVARPARCRVGESSTPRRNRRNRGQGAMEYLMTYGWAILVVMMVGAAMWRLGVFDTGSGIPPTSTGFPVLKPFLATCKMGDQIWGPSFSYNGFNCQFANNAGGDIWITNVNVTADRRQGTWSMVQDQRDTQGTGISFLYHYCQDEICSTQSQPCSGQKCEGSKLHLKRDETFFIILMSRSTHPYTYSFAKGKNYLMDVTVDYETDVGGARITKRETGQIMITR
jgi:hypothetical protein